MGYRKPVEVCGPYTIAKDLETRLFHLLNLNGEEAWRTPFKYRDHAVAAGMSLIAGDDLDETNSYRHILVRESDGKIFRGYREAAEETGMSLKGFIAAMNRSPEYGHCYYAGEIWEYAD